MRILLTSLLAFLVSSLAGGVTAQQVAVWTNAGQEFILVFMALALLLIVVTMVFFAAQFFGPRGVAVAGRGITATFALLLMVLFVFSLSQSLAPSQLRDDVVIIGILGLIGFVTIITHWFFVAWRLGGTPTIAAVSGTGA